MSLIAVGTIALDNVKTPSGEKKEMLGGSVAHFAMSARLTALSCERSVRLFFDNVRFLPYTLITGGKIYD